MYLCFKCWEWEWFEPCEFIKTLDKTDTETWSLDNE